MKIICIIILSALVGCSDRKTEYETAMFPDVNAKRKEFYADKSLRDILTFIEKGDVDSMGQLLDTGVNINIEGRYGMRPIFWALLQRKIESFEFLLKHGADPNSVAEKRVDNKSPASIIELAVVLEDSNYLRLLLEHGADPNTPVHYGDRTIIYTAILYDKFDNLKLLADAGANVNHVDRSGNTPIIMSATVSGYDMVHYLLSKGADPEIENDSGYDLPSILMKNRNRGLIINPKDYDVQNLFYYRVIEELKIRELIPSSWAPE